MSKVTRILRLNCVQRFQIYVSVVWLDWLEGHNSGLSLSHELALIFRRWFVAVLHQFVESIQGCESVIDLEFVVDVFEMFIDGAFTDLEGVGYFVSTHSCI